MSVQGFSQNSSGFQAIYPGTCQQITLGSSSAASAQLQSNTTIVEVYATSDCFLAFSLPQGAAPTAVKTGATAKFLPAGQARLYAVQGGTYISAIQSAAAGTLYICEGK